MVLNGRYQLQRVLGEGGMGAVYLALDLHHRRQVAIKVARLTGLEARDQFRREAAYLKRLHHHCLPRVWDYFSDTHRDFLVMEYIPGEDLEALVHRKGPQPEWLVLRWTDELLDGLDYLHNQDPPIIHRDIKPGNLKLRSDDTLVLVDFGIATELLPEKETQAGALAVTPGFSPPEQYTDKPTGPRSDVYSVGATLYFLATGVTPPVATDRIKSGAPLEAPSSKVAGLSASTDLLVSKAMSLEPEQRWASAAEMRRATVYAAQALAGTQQAEIARVSVAETNAATAAPEGARRSRRRIGAALALLVVAVGLVAAAAVTWPGRSPGTDGEATPVDNTASLSATPQGTPNPAAGAAQQSNSSLQTETQAAVASTPQPTAQVTAGTTLGAENVAAGAPSLTPAGQDSASGVAATSTPILRVRRATPTSQSPATNTPAVTATRQTPAVATPAATRQPASAPELHVLLMTPNAGESGRGPLLFQWQVDAGALEPGQAFEVRFWREGEDPLTAGMGLAGTTKDTGLLIDLDGASNAVQQFSAGDYLWGVVLVNEGPYAPLQLVSEARSFRFDGAPQTGGSPPGPTRQPDRTNDQAIRLFQPMTAFRQKGTCLCAGIS